MVWSVYFVCDNDGTFMELMLGSRKVLHIHVGKWRKTQTEKLLYTA
jgi:hypothetical protein